MTDRTLPEAMQIVIAQLEWDDIERRLAKLEGRYDYLMSRGYAGSEDPAFQKACSEAWKIEEQLKTLRAAETEIEDFLIEHNAPGWVAT